MSEKNQPEYFVKFTGTYEELVSLNWRYGKAFAREYEFYAKNPDGERGQELRIWKHYEGYVELDDYFSLSYLFFLAIQNKEHLNWYQPTKANGELSGCYYLWMNKKDGYLKNYIPGDNPNSFIYREDWTNEQLKEYHKTWREANIVTEVVEEIEMMFAKGMIQLVPYDEFPKTEFPNDED